MERNWSLVSFDRKITRGLLTLAAGLVMFGWLLNTPPGLLGKADAIGYAVCHRIDLRSFHIGDRPTALCARCTGMYLGAVLGLVFQWAVGKRRGGQPPLPVLVVLGAFVLAFAVDGGNSFAHLILSFPVLYEPNNTLRLLTGIGFGLVMAVAVYMAFSQMVWKRWDRQPVLDGLRPLVTLITLGVGTALLVLTENPLILYPLTLISVAGVFLILTMVYSLVWLMITKSENQIEKSQQLVLPLMGGFATALMQIGLLDLGRFLLTGTWEGFHIFLG